MSLCENTYVKEHVFSQKAHGQREDFGFFCNYATKILELEQINSQLSKRMELTKAHCIEVHIHINQLCSNSHSTAWIW